MTTPLHAFLSTCARIYASAPRKYNKITKICIAATNLPLAADNIVLCINWTLDGDIHYQMFLKTNDHEVLAYSRGWYSSPYMQFNHIGAEWILSKPKMINHIWKDTRFKFFDSYWFMINKHDVTIIS